MRPREKDFLICTVRNATGEQWAAQEEYVSSLEAGGIGVYWPPRDTDQDDPIGLRICSDNRTAMERADVVRVVWDPESQGSLFDLGMAFAMRKPIYLVNRKDIKPTDKKSFTNFLLAIDIGEPSPSSTRLREVTRFYEEYKDSPGLPGSWAVAFLNQEKERKS
jgi:hypothetical protein